MTTPTPAQQTTERLTDAEIAVKLLAMEWRDQAGSLEPIAATADYRDALADLQDARTELTTLRATHAEVLGTVRGMIKAIALAEHVDLRELGYVVTRGVTDESPQSWWDSQSWPIYHAIVSLVALSQEAQ